MTGTIQAHTDADKETPDKSGGKDTQQTKHHSLHYRQGLGYVQHRSWQIMVLTIVMNEMHPECDFKLDKKFTLGWCWARVLCHISYISIILVCTLIAVHSSCTSAQDCCNLVSR